VFEIIFSPAVQKEKMFVQGKGYQELCGILGISIRRSRKNIKVLVNLHPLSSKEQGYKKKKKMSGL